jgi:fagellar hook-basal body proteins
VKGEPPRNQVTYTRNGAFSPLPDGTVVDSTGQKLQLLPVDANGNVTDRTLGGMSDFVLPDGAPGDPTASLINVSVDLDGLVTATYANGEDQVLGKVAMATFPAMEGLRPIGDAHWQSTGESGDPTIDAATNGPMGTIRSGTLERSNVDITEELVMLIGAQRNFQANAKAIEGASTLTQTIINLRT